MTNINKIHDLCGTGEYILALNTETIEYFYGIVMRSLPGSSITAISIIADPDSCHMWRKIRDPREDLYMVFIESMLRSHHSKYTIVCSEHPISPSKHILESQDALSLPAPTPVHPNP